MRWQQFRQNFQYGLARFLYGRNGPDQLTAALFVLALLFSVTSRLTGWFWLLLLYYGVLLFCIYRTLSRNLVRRRAENAWFQGKMQGVRGWFRLRGRMLRERGSHRYLKCSGCGQRLRVPKGKGKIQITCSRCHRQMIKKV